MKILLTGLLLCCATGAQAVNPVILNELSPKRHAVDAAAARTIIEGFAACNPKTALAKDVFEAMGVEYINANQYPTFAYADLLRDRSIIVLRGNDPASMEQAADGRFMAYGSSYTLHKNMSVGGGVQIKAVKLLANVAPPRAVVGVTYVFNQHPAIALAKLDAEYGTSMQSIVDAVYAPLKAKTTDVWIKIDPAARAVSCWRYPDTRIKVE